MSETAQDSKQQAQFRQHCKDWLAANPIEPPTVRLPQSGLEIMTTDQMDYLQRWQKQAYEAGLVGCDYPEAYGGGGRSQCQRIANEEMQNDGRPFLPNLIGLGMAAPTMLHHASEDVKQSLLPPLLSGEAIWCQGFSEPGAGSDLASVQTFAEPHGDKWRINGHKVWTSLAHFADWMILLARTDKSQKHGGLTYFVVPIKSQLGSTVSVRPLIKITGETGFNEVIFENLEIDDGYRLDEVGKGWDVAMTTLLHERGASELVTPSSSGPRKPQSDSASAVMGLLELAKSCYCDGVSSADDPMLRDRLMQMMIRMEGHAQNQRRAQVPALCDHPMRIPLQWKLVASEIAQDAARLGLDLEGAAGSLTVADANAPAAGRWPLAYMNSFGFTIAAGTSEVQRNILGERVLGLPKSK